MKRNRTTTRERKLGKKDKNERVVKDKFEHEIRPQIQPLNDIHREFLSALATHDVILFSAPAGVGKTIMSMSEVTDWLKKGLYNKLTLSRPSVHMGNTIGLLKGDLVEKFQYFIMPMINVIKERYGTGWYENSLSNGTIQMLPFEYVRGMTIRDVFVIDEVQNTKPDELYTLLTRMEEGSKLILLGDPNQHDLVGVQNGIDWLEEFVERNKQLSKHVKIIKASSNDIVRGGLCKAVVKAREKELRIDV